MYIKPVFQRYISMFVTCLVFIYHPDRQKPLEIDITTRNHTRAQEGTSRTTMKSISLSLSLSFFLKKNKNSCILVILNLKKKKNSTFNFSFVLLVFTSKCCRYFIFQLFIRELWKLSLKLRTTHT